MMETNRREFLKQMGWGLAGLYAVASLPREAFAAPNRTFKLPRAVPEAQGVSSAKLLDFINAVETRKLNVHSVMVVRHGQVVAEGWWAPYSPTLKHTLYSLSKSFTSTAVGLAVAEGKLSVDDKVVSFFPNDVPATISTNLAAMRVKDLLTMSTGHDKDTTAAVRGGSDPNWVKTFLAQPVDHQPGTHFVYNSGATYMLSAIVQKLTGQPILAYLKPRLFDPLGIEGADWEVDPNGICVGGWGLRVKTEDIAKFGQMYLQKGMWNGKRILPETWVADATRFQVQSAGGGRPKEQNDWLQGYGYQFWRCRHDAYRGDGAFGQYCIVLPKEDAVVAITSETGDMQAVMDEVWTHILGGFRPERLPADAAAHQQLTQKLAALSMPLPVVSSTSPLMSQISGKTFGIDPNAMGVKSVGLNFGKEGCLFTMRNDQGEHRILCGLGRRIQGETGLSIIPIKLVPTPVPGETKNKVSASGTWTDPNTFEMIWRFNETAHYDRVTCRFDGDQVQVTFTKSLVVLNPNTKDDRPVLHGKLMASAMSQGK